MPDWTLIRSFLAVAETGSLSAAAKALGLTQPTVGRHVRDLEEALGLRLFERLPRGLDLTDAGLPLVAEARAMAEAAGGFHRKAEGRSECIAGTVRLTASRMMATFVLPPIVARMRLAEPGLQIEIAATDVTQNLLRRDADIALRMATPRQGDLMARKVADLPIALYGAPSYLARKGRPRRIADLADHDLVGMDRDDDLIRALAGYGLVLGREDFAVRCDDHIVGWRLVAAGAGLGFTPRLVGDAEPAVERVELDGVPPSLPMWLVMHKDVRTSHRLRFVADFLWEALPRP